MEVQVIATNDVHYTLKEDWDDHDTLLCIGTGKKKADTDRMRYSNDFWIKSEEEMYESFAEQMQKTDFDADDADEYTKFYKVAIENTQLIADKVDGNIKLGSDKPLFSNVQVPKGFTPETWLTQKAFMGMYKYLAKHPEYDVKEYEARLASELDIINSKGFAPYMLAVEEYVTWANENNCPTGPGRGSAAGSLALFSIGVTKNIDPIQNQLLFSRFLTADRKDPPDIDTDFEYEHRDDVIEHLKDYYGEECVAHIGTYSAMGVKSGLKDVARVLDIDFKTINDITKAIDGINDSPGLKFKDLDAMKDGDENEKKPWQDFDRIESNNKELFRLARAFEGTPRNQGVHASGVLVTPMPVTDLFPVRYKDGVAIALYTGPQLEHYGAIKYDVLGLKTLDIIQKTIDAVDAIEDFNDLYDKADIEDAKVWKYIANKNTEAVFQIESDMMKGIVDRIQPNCFGDLGAICAIGRPGPISIGLDKKYADVKNGKAVIEYPIRGCEDILDETFGNPVYQEQLMAISKKIANFNDMQADSITRKILGKKSGVIPYDEAVSRIRQEELRRS
ncbi:DNA polymerase-3 subunit alpha [Selenomonas ruminantium]|uniref:DNA polymerase-3 subunit alpha n=1 Tax=Selenomonas ruminantium TaxID=971 RepID=A0A1M6X331_SELRU|nr:DNA polymerase III subunit alpha [Selenomonas ruminantium]SHL00348.1 DNA polymerase-3 subunit alpha [Selenomonas ruminantium]